MTIPVFVDHFETLAPRYDVLLCDVWGVVHNSLVASPEAHDALSRFRAKGGAVVLITNAPRPDYVVKRHLDQLGVPQHAYDAIVASGDVTRRVIERRQHGKSNGSAVFHIGPERDRPLFKGLNLTFSDANGADYVVCTGLFDDETETAETYRPLFETLRKRNMFMLCANPDLVVERGARLIYCAGALAELYETMGGEVVYAGKPHPPIYEEALAQAAAARGQPTPRERVLAIGNSIRTDIQGAATFGVDSLFVTAGIHAEELGTREDPDITALRGIFEQAGVMPKAVTRQLAW